MLEAGVAQAPFVISAYDEQIGYGTCPGAPGDCPSLGWEVVSDEDRGDVLEVTHDASSNNAGLILAVDPMDMSDYADAGKISFDIRSLALTPTACWLRSTVSTHVHPEIRR